MQEELITVTKLQKELSLGVIRAQDFLHQYGIKPHHMEMRGRGIRAYLSKASADKVRAVVLGKRKAERPQEQPPETQAIASIAVSIADANSDKTPDEKALSKHLSDEFLNLTYAHKDWLQDQAKQNNDLLINRLREIDGRFSEVSNGISNSRNDVDTLRLEAAAWSATVRDEVRGLTSYCTRLGSEMSAMSLKITRLIAALGGI